MTGSFRETLPLRKLLVGAGSVLLARLVGAVGQFVFYLVLGNQFGAEGLGLFVLALTVSVVASTIGRWGLDQLMLRRLSGYHARSEHVAFRALFIYVAAVVFFLSALIGGAMWLLAPSISRLLFGRPELSEMLRVFAFSVPPMALIQLAGEGMRAAGKSALSAMVQTGLVPLLALGFLACTPNENAVNAAVVYFVAGVIVLFASLSILAFTVFPPIAAQVHAADTPSAGELLASGTPIAWVAILSAWLGFSETILLAGFRGGAEVGLYAAALRLATLVNFLLLAFNTLLAPRFAVLYGRRELVQIRQLARVSVLTMLALATPIFLAFFLFPGTLLAWFGSEFRAAAPALMILTVGQLINLSTGPVGTILLMTGNEQVMKRHTVTTVLINLVAAIMLIPAWGVAGAAASAAIGMATLNLLSWYSARALLQPKQAVGAALK